MATVGKIFLINAFVSALVFLLLSPFLGSWIFSKYNSSSGVLFWLVIPIFFSCINVFFLGVLNGNRAVGRMGVSQAVAAVLGALIAYPSLLLGGVSALIVLLIVISVATSVVSVFFLVRSGWLDLLLANLFKPLDRKYALKFLSVSSISLVVGLSGTVLLLGVRIAIARGVDLASAGIFDAAWTISSMSLMILLGSFGAQILPEMSSEANAQLFNRKLSNVIRLSVLASVAILIPSILFKQLLIELFYSKLFLPSLDILRWMLIGDYFKVTAWALSMPLLARVHMRAYLFLSLSWNFLFLFSGLTLFLLFRSIEIIGIAYLFAQVCFVILAFAYWSRRHGFVFSGDLCVLWLAGASIVIFFSVAHWDSHMPSIVAMLSALFFTLVFCWYGLEVRLKNLFLARFTDILILMKR
jgi:PST family polysaccharide transporter